jgi:hypothetical protein
MQLYAHMPIPKPSPHHKKLAALVGILAPINADVEPGGGARHKLRGGAASLGSYGPRRAEPCGGHVSGSGCNDAHRLGPPTRM